MLWKIFRGVHRLRSVWFPLLFACRFVEFDTSVIYLYLCILILFTLISIARYAFKTPRTCFRGTKLEIYREHVAFEFYILTLGPAVIRTVCEYSRWILHDHGSITSLPLIVFLWGCRSFTARRLCVCHSVSRLLCFLQVSDRVYASLARCIGLFLLWSFWYMIQM